jgi:hypothetical protein
LNTTLEATDNPSRRQLRALMLRLVPASIFFILLFYLINPFYVRFYLPLIAAQLEWMDPTYDVEKSEILTINRVQYLQYTITVSKPIPERPYTPQETGNTFELKAQANTLCIAPIIVFSLILAWPGLSLLKRLQTFLLSLPLILLVHALDLPMIFIAIIESVHSTSAIGNTALSVWSHILNGGRQFLALVAFLISIAPIYIRLDRRPPRKASPRTSAPTIAPRRNDPCPCGSGKKYKNCCLPNH